MANNAKGNNGRSNKGVTTRGGFLQSTSGPKQQRSTIPMKGATQQLSKEIANAMYYDNGSMKQTVASFLLNQAQSHPKVGPAIAGAKMINNMLPPNVKITNQTIPNALNAFKGNPMKSGEPNVMNSSYGLSKAPNPKPVSLNSGVVPNTYANDYMTTQTGLCSPLHISACTLSIPTDTRNDLATYFTNTICFDIQTRAQANVNFQLDITTILSSANLTEAFNAAIGALQVYYYYASILSYESDPRNKNSGMINLRQNISPTLLSDLSQLGKRLEDTPIPPRIVEWVRYMSMNYLAGDTQGSPIIKIGFNPTVMDTFTSPTPIAQAFTRLTATTTNSVYTLMRRAIPQWRVGTLFDVPTTPVYDKNFLSIFANLGSVHYNGATAVFTPTVPTKADLISYNSFSNKLDGVAYAMGGINVAAEPLWRPGLCSPISSATVWSRRSYYSVAGAAATWENVVTYPFLGQSRIESYQYQSAAGSPVTTHLFAEKAQGVSVGAITQTSQNVLDFLFNIKSIPLNGKVSNFNKTGSGRNNMIRVN